MGRSIAAGLIWGLLMAAPAGADCAPGALDLRWQGGQARFTVEIANTAAQREQGLMYREHMASAAGMLFVYDAPQHAYFWMKNTLIPLDMIFADETGRVSAVHSNAVPGDLTPIDGGEGVRYVVEINAGLAERMGIAPGTLLRAAEMDQAPAEWKCAQ